MQIFISCEREDMYFASRLANDLHAAGAEVDVSGPTPPTPNSLLRSLRRLYTSVTESYSWEAQQVGRRMAYHWLVAVMSPHVFSSRHVQHEVDASLESPSASVVLIDALPYHKKYLPRDWIYLPCFDATRDYQSALSKLLQHVGLPAPQSPPTSVGQVVSPVQVPHAQSVRAQTSAALTVFVSYSHQDDNFVRRLISDLHTRGIGVWVDHERLKPGTADWDREIRRGISAAKGVIYVASEDAAASPYVGDELAVARDNHVVVYPLWARGSKWSSCAPLGWGRTQYIDAREGKYEAAVRALVASILGSVGR